MLYHLVRYFFGILSLLIHFLSCSLICYRLHKDASCPETADKHTGHVSFISNDKSSEQLPLRPLTSLRWPYAPDESAFPDPLKRDDPKPLQIAQYEAIGDRHFLYLITS